MTRSWLVGLLTLGFVITGDSPCRPWPHADAQAEKRSDRQLQDLSLSFATVASRACPAVVHIESHVIRGSKEESGSGVLVRAQQRIEPVILTNAHVVRGAQPEQIDVFLSDGRVIHPENVWTDEETDLAVLAPPAELTGLPVVRLGSSDAVHVGEWVLAIGSPFGLMQSVSHGIISATQRRSLGLPNQLRIREFLQTDAPINPGSSGGPLLNLQAEVIGINTAIASHTASSSGVAFSIPINLARRVMEDLLTHGKVRRAYLGVGFPSSFPAAEARKFGLPTTRGALVAIVHPSTPAARAGILPQDVIIEIAGFPIDDDSHLINVISHQPVGQSVGLVVWRNRQRVQLTVELGDWSDFQKSLRDPQTSEQQNVAAQP